MQFFTHNFHLINIPPLLAITIYFIIGIICHWALPILLTAFILVLCFTLFAYKRHIPFPHKLILCSFFALTGAYLHQKELRDYDDFYTFTNNKSVTISGTVIDRNETVSHYKKSIVITVALNTITNESVTRTSNKAVMFYCEKENNLTVGDAVTFFNVRCKKPSSESFQRYHIKEQIASTVFDNKLNYTIDNHPTWSVRRYIWNQKQRLLNGVKNKLSCNGFKFFSSLFLGNRSCIKEELEPTNEQFKTWGISHFLARSGLHLALFIFIWQAIFCVIPLPFMLKQCIVSLLSFLYFILTWTSAPFTRSFALFMLNKLCLLHKKSFHLVHYLTLVCLCFLIYCPVYLFFLDFQLSFALTFALAWFSQLAAQHHAK